MTMVHPHRSSQQQGSQEARDHQKRPALQVLIVDEKPVYRLLLRRLLAKMGHEVIEGESEAEALEKFERHPVPIVVTNLWLGERISIDLITEILRLEPETVIVVMTADSNMKLVRRALEVGAFESLARPFLDLDVARATLLRAIGEVEKRAGRAGPAGGQKRSRKRGDSPKSDDEG